MRITEINTVLRTIEYSGEHFVNLQELRELLKIEPLVEIEEVLITPYYIQDNKRMELYQYEFYCTNDFGFEDYILTQTGKKRIEDVPEEILYIKKNCFATLKEVHKLIDFINFILENEDLQEEVKQVFGKYMEENLYAIVY